MFFITAVPSDVLEPSEVFLIHFSLPNPQLFSPTHKRGLKYNPVCPKIPNSDLQVSDYRIFFLFLLQLLKKQNPYQTPLSLTFNSSLSSSCPAGKV